MNNSCKRFNKNSSLPFLLLPEPEMVSRFICMSLTGSEYTNNNRHTSVSESTYQSHILSTTRAGQNGQKYYHILFLYHSIYIFIMILILYQ